MDVGKAAGDGDLAQWQICRPQQLLGVLDSEAEEILVWRQAEMLPEDDTEVRRGEIRAEERRAELNGVMWLESHRHINPVKIAEPRLDQVRMGRETDMPTPCRKSLLPSRVVENVLVDVWRDRRGLAAERVESVWLDEAEISTAEQKPLVLDDGLTLLLLDAEKQIVEEAARRRVPRLPAGEVSLANLVNNWTRKHSVGLVSWRSSPLLRDCDPG